MILSLTIVFDIIEMSYASDGIIWSNPGKDFVPLSNFFAFLTPKYNHSNEARYVEYHNFQKEILKVAYFQETNLVSYIENDTKITGVCGELWTILADYLNFTLIPVKLEKRHFGNYLLNGTYDGILGLIQKNLSQIIPRCGVLEKRLDILEYTIPFWRIRYHLYIRPEWKHDEKWMFHLFSIDVWNAFFFLLLVLSMAGYITEKNSYKIVHEKIEFNFQDHLFYTVAIASSQGSVPAELHTKSRIIYLCTSMFSWVVFIAFNSNAIILMTNKNFILPFTGLRSLFHDSNYNVIAFKGSMVHQDLEGTILSSIKHVKDLHRVSYESSARELFARVCFSTQKKFAGFEAEDRHDAIGKHICRLIPTNRAYFETWISSAVRRGFLYKRSFDVGILKLFETGLLNGMKRRWLYIKSENRDEVRFKSIGMNQVYLIFSIIFFGFILSIVILLIELITFNRSIILKQKKMKCLPITRK